MKENSGLDIFQLRYSLSATTIERDDTIQLCRYIYKAFRPKYRSNRDFALACGVDEKTIRLIQQERYNLSLKKFKQICDAQEVKMSDVLQQIGE